MKHPKFGLRNPPLSTAEVRDLERCRAELLAAATQTTDRGSRLGFIISAANQHASSMSQQSELLSFLINFISREARPAKDRRPLQAKSLFHSSHLLTGIRMDFRRPQHTFTALRGTSRGPSRHLPPTPDQTGARCRSAAAVRHTPP